MTLSMPSIRRKFFHSHLKLLPQIAFLSLVRPSPTPMSPPDPHPHPWLSSWVRLLPTWNQKRAGSTECFYPAYITCSAGHHVLLSLTLWQVPFIVLTGACFSGLGCGLGPMLQEQIFRKVWAMPLPLVSAFLTIHTATRRTFPVTV